MTKEDLKRGNDLVLMIEATEENLENLKKSNYKDYSVWRVTHEEARVLTFELSVEISKMIYDLLKKEYSEKLEEYKKEFDELCCGCKTENENAGAGDLI